MRMSGWSSMLPPILRCGSSARPRPDALRPRNSAPPALWRTALRSGSPAHCVSCYFSLSLKFRCALALGICWLSGKYCGHLVEALLHAGTGKVPRLFGRVAVLHDGHLRPVVACGFEDDHVRNVVRDSLGHAHRGGIEMRPVLIREVGDELDPLARVDPGVRPRVVGVLTAVLRWRAHAHQRCPSHAKVHLGTG